jgi:hypothetical protein
MTKDHLRESGPVTGLIDVTKRRGTTHYSYPPILTFELGWRIMVRKRQLRFVETVKESPDIRHSTSLGESSHLFTPAYKSSGSLPPELLSRLETSLDTK